MLSLTHARCRGEGSARAEKEDDVLSSTAHAADAAHSSGPLSGPVSSRVTSETLLSAILESLSDMKAEDIVQIDLRGKSSVCDYMVICSGRSSRQVAAIAERVEEVLKQDHGTLSRTEGKETGDWVLIDAGDVVVHVFRPEVRDFYQLEKMWQPVGASGKPGA
jgi:ribosome-associated protein